ncbi:MAG: hypothetical protein JEY79_12290 [Pseudodesulfovibrio sp.]|nr:hypothetical protein [Pseudodesulfovibrio sp.]
MKILEEKKRKLKRLVADLALDRVMLQAVLPKKNKKVYVYLDTNLFILMPKRRFKNLLGFRIVSIYFFS